MSICTPVFTFILPLLGLIPTAYAVKVLILHREPATAVKNYVCNDLQRNATSWTSGNISARLSLWSGATRVDSLMLDPEPAHSMLQLPDTAGAIKSLRKTQFEHNISLSNYHLFTVRQPGVPTRQFGESDTPMTELTG